MVIAGNTETALDGGMPTSSAHDTIDRGAYMPGVLLTVRKVRQLEGLVYGLERLL